MASMIAFILAAGTMPGIGSALKTNHENFYRWYSLLITAAAAALALEIKGQRNNDWNRCILDNIAIDS